MIASLRLSFSSLGYDDVDDVIVDGKGEYNLSDKDTGL
jgi:hypothetical protein